MGFLSGFEFEILIAPRDRAEFFRDHWDRAPMVENRRMPDFYGDLLSLEEIDHLLVTEAAPYGGWAVPACPLPGDAPDPIDLDGALTRMEQGAALVLKQAESRNGGLGTLCRILHAELGYPCSAEIGVALRDNKPRPAQAAATGVFILQICGSRRWMLGSERHGRPRRNQPARPVVPGPGEQEVSLAAGDLLYLPRGWPAQSFGNGDISVQITISVAAPSWREVIDASGQESGAASSPVLDDLLEPGWIRRPREELAAELSRRWPEGGDAITAQTAIARAAEATIRGFPIDLNGRLTAMLQPRAIRAETVFAARPDLLWSVARRQGTARLEAGPLTIDVPVSAAEALEFCLSSRRYTVADLPGTLATDERVGLLDRLARNVLIRRLSA